MRVLVTWESRNGGTAGIGQVVAGVLEGRGFDVTALPAEEASDLGRFDAVIVGGALYLDRWPRGLSRFVKRNTEELSERPVWFFSSGPLDDSAEVSTIPATQAVAGLAKRVGVRGHMTFGGRLAPDAKGFLARLMARNHGGDWRNEKQIRAWATTVADDLSVALRRTVA